MEETSIHAWFRQTYISLTIAAISFLSALNEKLRPMQTQLFRDSESIDRSDIESWSGLCPKLFPFVGVILLTIIAEYCGRKPACAVIIILTIAATSLFIQETVMCWKAMVVVTAISYGGRIILFYVCIAEYCEPKSRLVFSITTITLHRIGFAVAIMPYSIYFSKIISIYYVLYFGLFVATVCFVSLLTWPESPYWLLLNGRLEQSKKSFSLLWANRTASEKEYEAIMDSRDRPYTLKLFCVPFLMTIILFSTYWCSYFYYFTQGNLYSLDIAIESDFAMVSELLIILLASAIYKLLPFINKNRTVYVCTLFLYNKILRHKIKFITLALLLFAISQYAFITYVALAKTCTSITCINRYENNYSTILIYLIINYALVIIGPTTLSMSKYAEHVPLKRRSLFMCFSGTCFFLIGIFYHYLTKIGSEIFGIVISIVLSTLMLFGISAACILGPSTVGKTLMEIEELYSPKLEQTEIGLDSSNEIEGH